MQTIRYPHNRLRGFTRALLVATLTSLFVMVASAQNNQVDVTTMSVEDLMNMQVTSVSKRTQKVADAAAAVYVITQEDIRRSGATNIPEALRLAPGVQVARIDENKWAISARGFQSPRKPPRSESQLSVPFPPIESLEEPTLKYFA